MLRSVNDLYGHKLGAFDGEIGHVKDFYFDDQSWAVRYLITDTASWLTGRKVLIPPHVLGSLEADGKHLLVNLTRRQIEDSPLIESHKPVSRQFEEEYYRYYGLPYYWQGDGLWGMTSLPVIEIPPDPLPSAGDRTSPRPDPHLRSTQAVKGYHIQATDGMIGHICDFMMDERSWRICQLVVKTGGWLSGKEVLIDTTHVGAITFEESTVSVDMNRASVESSMAAAG